MASEDPTVPTPMAVSVSPRGALNSRAIIFTHRFCFSNQLKMMITSTSFCKKKKNRKEHMFVTLHHSLGDVIIWLVYVQWIEFMINIWEMKYKLLLYTNVSYNIISWIYILIYIYIIYMIEKNKKHIIQDRISYDLIIHTIKILWSFTKNVLHSLYGHGIVITDSF